MVSFQHQLTKILQCFRPTVGKLNYPDSRIIQGFGDRYAYGDIIMIKQRQYALFLNFCNAVLFCFHLIVSMLLPVV